jgi:hypothetical protein
VKGRKLEYGEDKAVEMKLAEQYVKTKNDFPRLRVHIVEVGSDC